MATRRETSKEVEKKTTRRPPATTPEGRENQLISLSADLAEKQLRDGTASSQVMSHFLKLGSTREKLEQERLQNENHLLRARADAMESAKRVEELYGQALDAMRAYAGHPVRELEAAEDDYND